MLFYENKWIKFPKIKIITKCWLKPSIQLSKVIKSKLINQLE